MSTPEHHTNQKRVDPERSAQSGTKGRVCSLLAADHLEDLRRSGLSDATIEAWGCFSIRPQDRHFLKAFAKGVEPPGLALPILPPGALEHLGFTYKPDNPRISEKNGRTLKYESPRGCLNRLHVPRGAHWLFRPPDGREGRRRIVITEGQKKAEKAVQEGVGCVSLFGVWSWFLKFGDESIPIEELSGIDWTRYSVEICFDSDTVSKPQVRRAERALSKWLLGRGAEVAIVRIPPGESGAKVGLDDYLLTHSAADFEALERLSGVVEPPLQGS